MSMIAGSFNVEATLNDFFIAQVAAWSYPGALFSARPNVRVDWSLIPQSVPCFSLVYIPIELRDKFQGRHVGTSATQLGGWQKTLLEISSWSTSTNPKYMAQLRTMRDFIYETFLAYPSIVIKDFTVTPATPTVTSYKVNVDLPNEIAILRDENPALYRSRSLITLSYTARAA
jgi:hypothetical protein